LGVGYVSAAICRVKENSCFYEMSLHTSQNTRPYFSISTWKFLRISSSFFLLLGSASGPWPSHLWGFEITLRHSTFGRNPLDNTIA